jgi:uncharacterized protein (TIGR03437 family)
LSWVLCAWFATSAVAFGQSYIFKLEGQGGPQNQAVGWISDDFSRSVSGTGVLSGAFQVVSTPNGAQFYILAPGGVQVANSTFTTLTTVGGITGVVKSATMSADGKYLLVLTDLHLYLIATATNTIAVIDAGVPTNGGTVTAVAGSHDGKTAWILTSNGLGSTLTAVNLVTLQNAGTLDLGSLLGTSLTLSPQGLLYVTFQAQLLYEINPATMSLTTGGSVSLPNGISGPLRFTPDGSTAYSVNSNVCALICGSIFKLTVASHSVSAGVPSDSSIPAPQLSDVFVGGGGQVYAISGSKLWDVLVSPLALSPSTNDLLLTGLPTNNVLSVTISNERPSPRYLYLLTQDNNRPFARVDLLGGGNGGSVGTSQNGSLSFDPIPAVNGAASFYELNPSQTVGSGAISAPFIAQLVNAVGRPVFNQQVTFVADATAAAAGLVVNTPSQVSGAEGYVQTTITAPAAQGTYLVNAISGAAIGTFTVIVGSGSNPGGSSPQMTIYSGDGELLRQQTSTIAGQPLTVKITDSAGNPLPNIPVTFTVTQGPGFVQADAVTQGISGNDGLAATNFVSGTVDQSFAFQPTTVNASSVYGSVDFVEVTHNALDGQPDQPNAFIQTPEDLRLTIPQGGSLPNGVVAKTISGHFPQAGQVIPNVGIRLAEQSDLSNSKVVSCAGSSRGDNQGISRCNVVAACQVNTALPRDFGVVIAVGEAKFFNLLVTVTAGTAATITPTSGNGQSGHPGDPAVLTAKVTDGCGQAVGGVTVVWTVTQASTGTASVTPLQATSQTDGIVSARVLFGSTPGQIVVQASAGALASASFQLTNSVQVASISLAPGNNGNGQSVVINQAFPLPVNFVVRDANGAPVPGLLVNFSASNGASVSASGTTNSLGQVQTNVTAGPNPGSIAVTATYNALSATATLSSHLPGPEITSTSFRNAASLAVGLTPCGLITVTGNGLAPGVQGVLSGLSAFGPLPYTLGPVTSILVNNIQTPIQAVANQNGVQQVNFQAPCELQAGTATVVINVSGGSATVSNVPVFAVQPGIFTFAGPNNLTYGAVIRAVDGSYVTPSNPARQGERLYMVVTGMGQGTPPIVTNSAGNGTQNIALPVVVGISDRGVPVLSARYLVGSIGAYLIEFQVPTDSPIGPNQNLAVAALTNNGTTFVFGNPVLLPAVAGN